MNSPVRPLPSRTFTRDRVGQNVVDYVKELIYEGQLPSGSRIPQDQLARVLGVSNTPVRDAIIALEHEGLVRIEPHRGAFVKEFDESSLRDEHALFTTLFQWVIRRADGRYTRDQELRLGEIATALATCSDPAEMFTLVYDYTEIVEIASGSPHWRRLVNALPRPLSGRDVFALLPSTVDAAREHLPAVIEAILSRDLGAGSTAVEAWMERHFDAVVTAFMSRGLIAQT